MAVKSADLGHHKWSVGNIAQPEYVWFDVQIRGRVWILLQQVKLQHQI